MIRKIQFPRTFVCVNCHKKSTMPRTYYRKNGSICPECKEIVKKRLLYVAAETKRIVNAKVGNKTKDQWRAKMLRDLHKGEYK